MWSILVTGGCGYIGSHTVVELLLLNYNVIILDSLINSEINILNKIKKILICSGMCQSTVSMGHFKCETV